MDRRTVTGYWLVSKSLVGFVFYIMLVYTMNGQIVSIKKAVTCWLILYMESFQTPQRSCIKQCLERLECVTASVGRVLQVVIFRDHTLVSRCRDGEGDLFVVLRVFRV